MKLKSKTVVQYTGEVVDLCVSNSHTYNVERVAVHNSGGGSLVAYVLYITDLDPLEWDLPFARFLSVYRKGAPDIDCVHENHLVVMANGTHKRAGDIVVGDLVLGGDGLSHNVTATYHRCPRDSEVPFLFLVKADDGTYGSINVVPRHKFVLEDGTVKYADELCCEDVLMSTCKVSVSAIDRVRNINSTYVDLTVEDDHRFHIVPFNVEEVENHPTIFRHTTSY
jgi:hypothetical protein